jgi:hypothetical protein
MRPNRAPTSCVGSLVAINLYRAKDSSAVRVCDTGHGAFARRAIYLRDSRGILSFKQELYMRNQMHELSIDDLDEVSGGIAYGPSLTPSIPIPPPVLALLGQIFGPSPQTPGGPMPIDARLQ